MDAEAPRGLDVTASLGRGRAALDRGAWQAAREAFETALAVHGETPEALEGLGWALHWLDQTGDSLNVRERAFLLFREKGDTVEAARVALGLAVDSVDLRGEAPAAGWLERARRLLDGVPACAEHGWLALWDGHFALHFRRDTETAAARAREARERAATAGLFDLEMLASALEGLVLVADGDVAEGMRRLDEAASAALAGEMRQLDAVGATCCLLVHACERARDYDRAAQWAERIERFAGEWGIAPALTVCRTQHAAMCIGRGEWVKAEEELLGAVERLAVSRPLLVVEGLEHLGELRRRQGRWEEAEELFARAEGRSLPLLGRGAIALDRGDAGTAADLLERFLRRTPPDNWSGRAAALELLVRAELQLGRRAEAGGALERLRALRERVDSAALRAAADVAGGLVAAADGEWAEAVCRLEDAVDAYEAMRAPFEASRARLDLARCLLATSRHGIAAADARAALDGLERLGAAREAFRARRLVEEITSSSSGATRVAPAAVPARAADLTSREIEVLRLVAQGLGDKEIAERLCLSGHTVHRHVSNIRTKLSLPSRAAAVAWAAQNGLL
jgi:DNA-binding NarL/FixJ family response regulator